MSRTERREVNEPIVSDRRLGAQQVAHHQFSEPGEVVEWLGAVQAQDYGAAKWAVALRLAPGVTDANLEQAVGDGTILRTHVMRWTWQFVSPADLRWMLALVAPRLVTRSATRHRQLGLEAATFRRSNSAIEKALRGGRQLTREELAGVLGSVGISTAGQRLAYLLGWAEIHGVICSGARRGKQSTYALLDDRVPKHPRTLTRDESLAELAFRYFRSRGPATVADFVWWSGLSPSDGRAGLEFVKAKLVSEVIGGQTHWRGEGGVGRVASATVHLLPAFDEYLVAYRNRDAVLDPKHVKRINAGGGLLAPCIVAGGRVIGIWRRTLTTTTVTIELRPFQGIEAPAPRALDDAATRYAHFLGLALRLGHGGTGKRLAARRSGQSRTKR
jgi:hypothetical protein